MEIPCADLLCKASRQLLPTVLSGASVLAGRRGDWELWGFPTVGYLITITIDRAGCSFLTVEGSSSFPFSVRMCAVLILGRKGVNWDANS